jgi:hypothetical protein
MSLSRQHYVQIASIITGVRGAVGTPDGHEACDRISRELATVFSEDNPDFSWSRFLQACGTQ